jgi:phosphomannomutase/phosphoglucomutase
MRDHIFRKYDIRGKVHEELYPEQVYDFAQAFACYILQKNPQAKTIVVGRDARIHSELLYLSLTEGLLDAGFDVLSIGICPTPVMYFTLHTKPVDAGIMITASHNDAEYNGFKLCYKTESIWGDSLQELKKLFEQQVSVKRHLVGTLKEYSMNASYIDYLVDQFSVLSDMHIPGVVDCLSGAAGAIIPDLIQAMGWSQVKSIHDNLDGTFPLGQPDPVEDIRLVKLKNIIAEQHSQFGIAFDGDGDRMVPVTGSGKRIRGDQVIALFAESLLSSHANASIVFDTKCSQVVPEIIAINGGKAIMAPTGHSIIKSYMQQHNALFGGELSCHFFFSDRYFGYDDGIYAMCRLLEHSLLTNKSFDQLLTSIPTRFASDELRIPCDPSVQPAVVLAVKDFFAQRENTQISLLDGVRVVTPDGWALVRQSHTQPLLSARFEANSPEHLRLLQDEIKNVLLPFIDQEQIIKEFGE